MWKPPAGAYALKLAPRVTAYEWFPNTNGNQRFIKIDITGVGTDSTTTVAGVWQAMQFAISNPLATSDLQTQTVNNWINGQPCPYNYTCAVLLNGHSLGSMEAASIANSNPQVSWLVLSGVPGPLWNQFAAGQIPKYAWSTFVFVNEADPITTLDLNTNVTLLPGIAANMAQNAYYGFGLSQATLASMLGTTGILNAGPGNLQQHYSDNYCSQSHHSSVSCKEVAPPYVSKTF